METADNRQWYESDLFRLAVIVVAALAIGVYLIVTCVLINPDGVFYIGRARELARVPWRTIRSFPPGYPALLLLGHKIGSLFGPADSPMAWIHSSQAVTLACRVLALVCLYFVGKLLVGPRRSFWAVLLLTFLPYPADFGSDTLREWPYLLCVVGAVWLLLWSLRTGRWWGFALVGVVTGLGYLIRPETAQVLVYAALGLLVGTREPAKRRVAALGLLVTGFLVAGWPYLIGRGTVVPHQLTETLYNRPPVITAVAGHSAGNMPLEFDLPAGEPLELAVEASDPDGDEVTLSVVAIPAGSRPVYWFEESRTGNTYLTLSEDEKDKLIANQVPDNYYYEGIAFYAWPNGRGRPQLSSIYGFWLSQPSWHVFTLDESERAAWQQQVQTDGGVGPYVAFYAYAPSASAPGTVPLYRYHEDVNGAPHWAADIPSYAGTRQTEPAWYAPAPAEPPAGLAIEDGAIHWAPSVEQYGAYTFNLIADDGQFQTCQLLHINVASTTEIAPTPSAPAAATRQPAATAPPREIARARSEPAAEKATLADAIYEIGGAFSENVMHILVLAVVLGLYRFLKDEAGPFERSLTAAIIVVNFALMVGRYMLVEPGPHRRYCQVLVAFSLLHVPAGIQIVAHWISAGIRSLRRRPPSGSLSDRFWYGVLVALALGPLCLPKMISPMNIEKRNYREVIDWLRTNTQPDEVVAAPDARIGFYADRRGPVYQGTPDPQSGDYIVTITPRDKPESVPVDWEPLYSPPLAANAPDRVSVWKPPTADR